MAAYSFEYCGGGHSALKCQSGFPSQDSSIEQLNALNNFQRNQGNPYSNTYNPGWRNHPNFSWSNQGGVQRTNQECKQPPPGFQQKNSFPQQHESKPNLESMMEKLLKDQLEQKETIKILTCQMIQLFTHNKMLENQISSQASSLRQSGIFPSQPENPREQAKAIMLRSGKKLPEVEIKKAG